MEFFSAKSDDQVFLPPGFRFHPTDEELITHYLFNKVLDNNFSATAIGEVDMNKIEPWDLPRRAKMGEKEWYFFCVRDKKYPTGMRTNRATTAGYWKATGKDKDIFRGRSLVGMKKTLVFYTGRAPKGEKSNWVIHEYRLDGKFSVDNLSKTARNEWVICRVFKKTDGGKKVHISGLSFINSVDDIEMKMSPGVLPQLLDSSSGGQSNIVTESLHVPCFSNTIDTQKSQKYLLNFNSPVYPVTPNASEVFQRFSYQNVSYSGVQTAQIPMNFQYSGTISRHDQPIIRGLLENCSNMRQTLKIENDMMSVSQETSLSTEMRTEISSVVSNPDIGRKTFEDQQAQGTPVAELDYDCLWSY